MSPSGSPRMTTIPRTRQRSRSPLTRPHRAGTPASSARIRPRRSSAWSPWPRQTGPLRLPLPWPSSPTRSGLGIWSGHPAGERPVPAVVRRLVEHRLPELVVAAVAGDPDVSHAAAAPGRFPGRRADARRPAHLRLARPQRVTERAVFRLVLEQRNGHLNDHARTSRDASMITAAGSEPGPGRVGPGAVIRAGCADRGGGGQSQHRMGLGHGGPGTRRGLAVSLAGQPVRLSGKFPGAAVMPWSAHRCPTCLVVLTLEVIPRKLLATSPTVACRRCDRARNRVGGQEREPDAATDVSAAW